MLSLDQWVCKPQCFFKLDQRFEIDPAIVLWSELHFIGGGIQFSTFAPFSRLQQPGRRNRHDSNSRTELGYDNGEPVLVIFRNMLEVIGCDGFIPPSGSRCLVTALFM